MEYDQPLDAVGGVVVSWMLGLAYFLCWSLSFYPQPILNYRRKSTSGLAIDFPTINVLGFICYSITTSVFLFSPTIRAQYALRHPNSNADDLPHMPTVAPADLAFAVHAVILSALTYTQFWPRLWGFKTSLRQKISRPIMGILVGSILAILAVVLIVAIKGRNGGYDARGWAWIDVIYTVGYVKLLITVVKYCPQAWVNYKRKSTVGWSIYQILLDVFGGIFSLLQLFLDSYMQGDWSGVTGNPVKFGLGNISIAFDIVFMVQHYWLYRGARLAKEGEQRPLLHHEEDLSS